MQGATDVFIYHNTDKPIDDRVLLAALQEASDGTLVWVAAHQPIFLMSAAERLRKHSFDVTCVDITLVRSTPDGEMVLHIWVFSKPNTPLSNQGQKAYFSSASELPLVCQ